MTKFQNQYYHLNQSEIKYTQKYPLDAKFKIMNGEMGLRVHGYKLNKNIINYEICEVLELKTYVLNNRIYEEFELIAEKIKTSF